MRQLDRYVSSLENQPVSLKIINVDGIFRFWMELPNEAGFASTNLPNNLWPDMKNIHEQSIELELTLCKANKPLAEALSAGSSEQFTRLISQAAEGYKQYCHLLSQFSNIALASLERHSFPPGNELQEIQKLLHLHFGEVHILHDFLVHIKESMETA